MNQTHVYLCRLTTDFIHTHFNYPTYFLGHTKFNNNAQVMVFWVMILCRDVVEYNVQRAMLYPSSG